MSIFSTAEWKTLYPASEYNTFSPRVKGHLIHYLLGQNQPTATINDQIEKDGPRLAASDNKIYNLTPLMIAVMQKREEVVAKLLTMPIVVLSINSQDQFGWTALHHACVTSQSIYQALIGAGAKTQITTRLGGSCADLKALTNLDNEGSSLKKVEGWPGQVKKYRDIAYFGDLKALWQQETACDRVMNQALIHDLKQETPLLRVAPFHAEFELLAGVDLPPGQIVGEYGGNYKKPKYFASFNELINNKEDAYTFQELESKETGNALRYINCGFPNLFSLECLHQGARKKIYLTFQAVKKGEPLLIDYGPKAFEISYGPQILLGKEEMRRFFQNGLTPILARIDHLDKTLKLIENSISKTPDCLEKMRLQHQLEFPLNNPLALLYLHFSNVIPHGEWLKLLKSEHPLINGWMVRFNNSFNFLELVLRKLEEIDSQLGDPRLQKWVLDNLEKLTLMVMIKAIEKFETEASIEEWLKSYDWTKDDTHIFSYQSRKNQLERKLSIKAYWDSREQKIPYAQALKALVEALKADWADFEGYEDSELWRMAKEIE